MFLNCKTFIFYTKPSILQKPLVFQSGHVPGHVRATTGPRPGHVRATLSSANGANRQNQKSLKKYWFFNWATYPTTYGPRGVSQMVRICNTAVALSHARPPTRSLRFGIPRGLWQVCVQAFMPTMVNDATSLQCLSP